VRRLEGEGHKQSKGHFKMEEEKKKMRSARFRLMERVSRWGRADNAESLRDGGRGTGMRITEVKSHHIHTIHTEPPASRPAIGI